MTDSQFSFKQFNILQNRCAMKVGTDSVLLGSWVQLPESGHLLDIGTGTGVLSLMAAQRSKSLRITAVEIDSEATEQARENIARSAWHERITVLNDDFVQWATICNQQYDCIISNPPYFEQSLLSPSSSRNMARHTCTLDYAKIFELSRKIIKPDGLLSLVLPADIYARTNETAQLYGWGVKRLTMIRTTTRKNAKRVLCEWQQYHIAPCTPQMLTIHNDDGTYSQEYISLTQDFYLHF